jgi:2-(1,2-epoxy-1,2-dihydrophenyl)acetyl-CoA isomerase
MNKMEKSIEIKLSQNIAELVLNKPETYNAFDLPMMSELAKQLIQLSTDNSIKGLIITGKGKAFCAGGDLAWVAEYSDDYQTSFHTLAAQFHAAVLEIRRMNKPVIAAINGVAAGGGFSLALACDFRVMEKSAMMKQAYTSTGLCIDGGGTFNLPRLIGVAKTLEIAAFDKAIPAQKAKEWGLVTKVVDDGKSLESAKELLSEMTIKSLHAFGMVKNLVNDSFHNSFGRVLEKERDGLGRCGKHSEGIEGIQAFLEKRKPNFIKNK